MCLCLLDGGKCQTKPASLVFVVVVVVVAFLFPFSLLLVVCFRFNPNKTNKHQSTIKQEIKTCSPLSVYIANFFLLLRLFLLFYLPKKERAKG